MKVLYAHFLLWHRRHFCLFQTHCYRATLETVIAAKRPDLRQTSLKTVAHAHRLSFADYATRATSQLPIEFDRELDFDSEGKCGSWSVLNSFPYY